ncbi:amidohydrolase [Caballeronia novacaledonica]|uniref:Amidohydrolase family protein n=1 Tax=Caballeronia novacaledonica TaxID=1544861 RepID=A0AA37IQ76_9BURK|nr:amidohydrolase family protein [Caballeronia novacaledonica]GJH31076.1 amidohydrolase family protein [Caballeronia novacaledonica]
MQPLPVVNQTILEPELRIIDSQHHLRDRRDSHYMFDDYVQDVQRGHNIVASVYVESMSMIRVDGAELLRPIGEIEFANGVAAVSATGKYGPCRIAAAIVGYADLRFGDAIAELLDRALAAAPDRLRGFRQCTLEHPDPAVWRYVPHPPEAGIMSHPQFRDGFKQLAARDLIFDAAVFHHQLPEITRLADDFPNTTIVLNHIGQVAGTALKNSDPTQAFAEWRRNIAELARRPNVMCKVGGMGQPYFGFGFELQDRLPTYLELASAWRPWAEAVIEIFGVQRCMMESNFPADRRSCDYVTLWNALKHIVVQASKSEKNALFHDNAARVYRIET